MNRDRIINCKGLTLVEVVVSMAIIAIVASFMLAVFGASFTLVRRGADLERFGDMAFSEAEASAGAAGGDTLSFSAEGRTYDIPGAYGEYSYSEGEVTVRFMVFDAE